MTSPPTAAWRRGRSPGLYDVKVDAEDLDGGSTTSTELGEFTVAWGDHDAMPVRVPEVL